MRWRLFFLIFLYGLFFSYSAEAQSTVKIRGKVLDKDTGKPLAGVNIVVLNTGFGGATDVNGFYVIENIPEGEYQLQVSFVGYQTVISELFKVESDHTGVFNFSLSVKPIDSEAIDVVGDRMRSDISDLASNVQIINLEDIQRSGCQSVGEVLQGMTGVNVQTTGGAGGQQTVSIRGSKTDQVLVLLDGVRIAKPHGGAADLSLIPVSMVQEITIIKGGNSAQYGADALAGVIYIKTKNPDQQKRTSINGQAGSFGMRSFKGAWGNKWERLEILCNYDHKVGDGNFSYTDPYGQERFRENADYTMDNIFTKINYVNKQTLLMFSGFVNNAKRGLPGFVYNLSPDARSADRQNIYNVRLYREISPQWSLEWQSAYNGYRDEDQQKSYPAYHTKNESYSMDNTARMKRSWGQHFSSSMNLSNRIDRGKLGFVIYPLSKPGVKMNQVTSVNMYNEYDQQLSHFINRFVGVASIGYARKHGSESYVTPKLGFVMNFDTPFSPAITSNWSRSFHLPDFYDLYYEGYRTLGNPNLKPERGKDFDAGGSLTIPLRGTTRFEGTYFYNTREDMIHWRQRFDGMFYPFNLSHVLIYGSEWEIDWRSPQEIFHLGINYTFMKALNKTGDRTTHNKILTNRPIHTANIQGNIKIQSFYVSLKQRFVSKRYVREANSKWIAPYGITDISMGTKLDFSPVGLQVRAGIYNLWNKEYMIIELAPMPGREFRVSGEVTF